ncbi:hypothetical protein OF117_16035 [Geodermatophilus sp. YIM 151500]|uniref:hypothetical protein n=1 Tax=Geodermatophilus sp. YIM 151500 TaxID=2984531 RepID=UPI0021E3C04C|nr:hypothetical protein [Geodermatophilus sp. YIM 151500]MCV2490865.1 hypothetical protein [Geodermatophilus sp. YIM 151500]
MLALTPEPLQTDAERAFFAELARWDTGGSVRAAVVASLPRTDGPLDRRLSDAVLFLPEGIAVVRVVEVVRQSGTVTARPEGAWTIGPEGAPGAVLHLAGGGSSPLDGLMRAGMDTAVRLRRAGLQPGRIARLTVLVGDVTGLVPADGDLGEGDQVATLGPRSLLLGIARAGRHAGVDNPLLWTTADVRAALEALELPGRGPTVEELNGEGFPYSPYVLRRPELLTPAGLAAAPAAAAAAPPASGAFAPPASPAVPPSVVPVIAPPPAPAGTGGDAPATAGTAGRSQRDTVAVDVLPAPAQDDTGGIGGLFASAEPDEEPGAPAAGGPAADEAGRPRTAVLPPVAPAAVAPAALPGADAVPWPAADAAPWPAADAVPGSGAEDAPARRRLPRPGRRVLLVGTAVLVLVLALGVGVVGLLRGGEEGPPVADAPTDPVAPPADPGPQPGATAVVDGVTFTLQAVQVDRTCADHAYGEVAAFFAGGDCTGLARALYSAELDGRPVVVSVARVRMPDTAAARALQGLADTNGTGNVNDLLREGVRYPGGPEKLSGAEYASALSGPAVTIVESSWVQPDSGSAGEIDAVAGAGLELELPDA